MGVNDDNAILNHVDIFECESKEPISCIYIYILCQDFQSITTELQDKADKQSVAIIVHEKYEEIVTYLKDALQVSWTYSSTIYVHLSATYVEPIGSINYSIELMPFVKKFEITMTFEI